MKKKNRYIVVKLGWLSKQDSKKLYRSIVIYFASKKQANKFLDKKLFKLKKESAYIDI